MSASLFHRRRAERLAQLLDEATGGPRHHTRSTVDGELSGYVQLSESLTRSAATLPRPPREFRQELRAMLVAAADREGIGATAVDEDAPVTGGRRARPSRPMIGSKKARGAVLVGLAAGTLALSGMSAASTDAMPGDALYGVKRSTESARLALAGSDVTRGQLYLDFARNRLDEAQSVAVTGTVQVGMLDDMDNETRAGIRLLTTAAASRRDRGALDVIDGFVRNQRGQLAQLGDSTRVLQSLALLDRIALRSAGLRADVSCGARADRSDDLGPMTAACKGSTGGTGTPSGGTHGNGVPGGSGPGRGQHPETTPTGTGSSQPTTGGVGGTGVGPDVSVDPSPSHTGILDDLGRLIGGGGGH